MSTVSDGKLASKGLLLECIVWIAPIDDSHKLRRARWKFLDLFLLAFCNLIALCECPYNGTAACCFSPRTSWMRIVTRTLLFFLRIFDQVLEQLIVLLMGHLLCLELLKTGLNRTADIIGPNWGRFALASLDHDWALILVAVRSYWYVRLVAYWAWLLDTKVPATAYTHISRVPIILCRKVVCELALMLSLVRTLVTISCRFSTFLDELRCRLLRRILMQGNSLIGLHSSLIKQHVLLVE